MFLCVFLLSTLHFSSTAPPLFLMRCLFFVSHCFLFVNIPPPSSSHLHCSYPSHLVRITVILCLSLFIALSRISHRCINNGCRIFKTMPLPWPGRQFWSFFSLLAGYPNPKWNEKKKQSSSFEIHFQSDVIRLMLSLASERVTIKSL